MTPPFIHLHVHTPYSFLDGASGIEALVQQAAQWGMPALAMTDHNSVAGVVKFVAACRAYGVRPLLGCELTLEDETHLTLLAESREGYSSLCQAISAGYAQGGRLTPRTSWSALEGFTEGVICLSGCRRGLISSLLAAHRYEDACRAAQRLAARFPGRFYLELQEDGYPDAHNRALNLTLLGEQIGLPTVATNNVHHARREDYPAWDILRCIGTLTQKEEVHPLRPLNSDRYLAPVEEMQARFGWNREALANTARIAERCGFALPEREDVTPRYAVPGAHADAPAYLRHLAYKGAAARYRGLSPEVVRRLDYELTLICQLGYADYFLMVWDIVRWARRSGIRATGRGSAADSCVAYALTLTDVDVIERDLPFCRFLVPGKSPDIDMDFPSEQRDDVFRYIVGRYGEAHVAMVCTFHTFWARSAVRDIGKALGISPEALSQVNGMLSSFIRADRIDEAFDRLPELNGFPQFREQFHQLFSLCGRISGFPRHLSTHSSGIVISRVPLAQIAPLSPSARGITQIWTLDKDDAEEIGAIKFDVLSLRTLSAVGDVERELTGRRSGWKYDRIPAGDEETYQMMQAGQSVGVFQFESPAQMALASVLTPQHFEDLVASVALIRPGPIRGHGPNRFVAARNGWCAADILHPAIDPYVRKTYGVIVFQEQVLQVVSAMTGCTEPEADRWRKALSRHHKLGTLNEVRERFIANSLRHHPDCSAEAAGLLFEQLSGWAGYGFTEGHAASFALTGYRTAYLSRHHPAEYFAGLMNHQPMGYYNANTLAAEARRRGVRILPLEINTSIDKCHTEGAGDREETEDANQIRLGLRLVEGLRDEDVAAIVAEREKRPFTSLLDFCIRLALRRDRIENLVLAGAFDLLHMHRRGLMWRLDETLGLASLYRAQSGNPQRVMALEAAETPCAEELEDLSPWEKLMWTWRLVGVCADAHPFAYLREQLKRYRILSAYEALQREAGERVTVAGLNIRPHRPPTRSGKPVLFDTLEDESEVIQLVCFGEAIQKYTGLFLTAPALIVRGVIERRGRGVMLQVEKARSLRLADFVADAPLFGQDPLGGARTLSTLPPVMEREIARPIVFGR